MANDSADAGQPTTILYGVVIGEEPLSVKLNDRITLSSAQLVLARNVTEHEIEITIEWETEEAGEEKHKHEAETIISSAGDPSHSHEAKTTIKEEDLTHIHEVKGRKKMIIHNQLIAGEEVILVRIKGGQKYLIVDRVVKV